MEKGRGKGTDTLGSDEYIKKQTVYEILDKMEKINNQRPGGLISDTVKISIRCVSDSVRLAHAEDIAPVRHGRWLEHHTWAKCSECGYLIGFETTYRPNCGARMDGDGDGV